MRSPDRSTVTLYRVPVNRNGAWWSGVTAEPGLAPQLSPPARPVGEHCGMVIALLAVLGVDLIVIVVLFGAVLTRRRWVSHQPGAFKGAIRVAEGAVSGLGGKWKRGYGRWVRDVLVWTKAPALFRNELVAVDCRSSTGGRGR
jgi:hypothetical protein